MLRNTVSRIVRAKTTRHLFRVFLSLEFAWDGSRVFSIKKLFNDLFNGSLFREEGLLELINEHCNNDSKILHFK